MEEKKEEPRQEEKKEGRVDKALKWYDRYKQIKRLRDFIKKLRGKTEEGIKETAETTEATTTEPQSETGAETTPGETVGETAEIPTEGAETAESGVEATTAEGEIGAETVTGEAAGEAEAVGAESAVGAETGTLAGTEAEGIIEAASAESAGMEASLAGVEGIGAEAAGAGVESVAGAGLGAEIGGAGAFAGAELGVGAGLEAGIGVGVGAAGAEATALGAGAGLGAAGVGAAGIGTGAAVGGGAAAGAGAAAAGAGAVAVGGGVVAVESNPVGWIITIVLVVIIIFVAIILHFTGAGGFDASTGSANNGNNGGQNSSSPQSLLSCNLTRSGQQVFTIKSSILAGWITDAANKAGIPPAVMASIAIHESFGSATSFTDESPEIKNNNFCNPGAVFCALKGQRISPDGTSCTSTQLAVGAQNAQALGLMQLLNIYHPGVNLCSITEDLGAAAQMLKDAGLNSTQPTENQVIGAVESYGGFSDASCYYGPSYPYNYCAEVWQDYQSCQVSGNSGSNSGSAFQNVLNWTTQISNALQLGTTNDINLLSYNKMVANISNNGYSAQIRTAQSKGGSGQNDIYWCTNLIIDSFNLAGISGLTVANDQAVYQMVEDWKKSHVYLDFSNGAHDKILKQVHPGFIFFLQQSPRNYSDLDHVAIVKDIQFSNDQGDGYMDTYDSNMADKINRYTISGWTFNIWSSYNAVGFGTF